MFLLFQHGISLLSGHPVVDLPKVRILFMLLWCDWRFGIKRACWTDLEAVKKGEHDSATRDIAFQGISQQMSIFCIERVMH